MARIVRINLRLWALFAAFLLACGLVAGCKPAGEPPSACEQCHQRIEMTSPAHGSCISCHGGDPREKDKRKAHRSMLAPRNPSGPDHWEQSCGKCHQYQLGRVTSNLMYTNTGMIRNIQLTWEGDDPNLFSTRGGKVANETGKPLELKPVAELDNLSGELYRKFCSRCHIGVQNGVIASGHASGCAACHFPYNDTGTYVSAGTTPCPAGRAIRQRTSFRHSPTIPSVPGATTGAVGSPFPMRDSMTGTIRWCRRRTVCPARE
jgi:hypothetical protein